jgi:hypothetical protein
VLIAQNRSPAGSFAIDSRKRSLLRTFRLCLANVVVIPRIWWSTGCVSPSRSVDHRSQRVCFQLLKLQVEVRIRHLNRRSSYSSHRNARCTYPNSRVS